MNSCINRPEGWKRQNHGWSRTPTYYSWRAMLARCLNPKDPKFQNYGGRGIKVCDRWLDFSNFIEDLGPKPMGKSLDRIDNDGGYEPSNCKWSTPSEQSCNRRSNTKLTINGQTKTISEFSKEYGIDRDIVYERITRHGWSALEAIETPLLGVGKKRNK